MNEIFYHTPINAQVERYNRTIIAELRHYVEQHPRNWVFYTNIFTFCYNNQIRRITNFALFQLMHSQSPKGIIMLPALSVSLENQGNHIYIVG